MNTTFYEKVGRRYVPVREYDDRLLSSLEEGHHLITVKPGSRGILHKVDPKYAELLAAAGKCKGAMIDAMLEAEKIRPVSEPLTKKQVEAWKALEKALGKGKYEMKRGSIADIVQAGIDALMKEGIKNER